MCTVLLLPDKRGEHGVLDRFGPRHVYMCSGSLLERINLRTQYSGQHAHRNLTLVTQRTRTRTLENCSPTSKSTTQHTSSSHQNGGSFPHTQFTRVHHALTRCPHAHCALAPRVLTTHGAVTHLFHPPTRNLTHDIYTPRNPAHMH